MNSRAFRINSTLFLLTAPVWILACSSLDLGGSKDGQGDGDGNIVGDGDAVGSGGLTGTGSVAGTGGIAGTGSVSGTGSVAGTGGTASGTGGSDVSGTGAVSGGSGGTVNSNCSNNLPTGTDWQEADCQMWADSGNCDQQWFIDQGACEQSCGRCSGGSSGGATGDGDGDIGGDGDGDGNASGGSSGMGNPWGSVNGNEQGWASRYWDCCKQSCAWPGKGGNSPVKSCDASGDNPVSQDATSACDNGGNSTTCNSYAPWAYSDEVAFGFVATHAGDGETCGTCYHIEFTGSSHNGGNDPGSQALAGKTMIVMATNIGGDVSGDGQLDLLVPGGGTGAMYGCDVAWGVNQGSGELGATYGGLRSGCTGDLNGIKSCVTQKCESLFGSRGLTEMYDGCMWYANWFQSADNPNFKIETIECPSELTSVAK